MAFRAGRQAIVTVAGTDISASLSQADVGVTGGTGETTTFGASWQTFLATLLVGTCSLSGYYDPTASTGPAAVLVTAITGLAAVAVVVKPGGSTTGQRSASFSAILTGYSESAPVGGIVTFTCSMTPTSTVTYTTL